MASAHDGDHKAKAAHTGGIAAPRSANVRAPFDIVHAKVTTAGNVATFHMAVSGKAGHSHPAATGKLAGSQVFSYVWPTSIDPYEVGFEHGAGILAMAVTAHPDFDDTPLSVAAEEFNRYNDRKLVMGDADVAALRIGGNFRWSNPDAFARLLQDGFGVRVEARGDLLVLHDH